MFGLFKSDPIDDPALGRLVHRGGYWRGRITLPATGEVGLAIAGGRSGPDAGCLAAAREFASVYERLRSTIAAELAEHRNNGLEEPEAGRPSSPTTIWENVRTLGVLIEPRAAASASGQVATAVVEYQTAWDEEHTLGAVIQGQALIELNGSVLPVF